MCSYDKSRWSCFSALLIVALTIGQQAVALEGGVRLSQSVEGVVSAGVEKGETQLDLADVDEQQELVVSGSRIQASAQRSYAAHEPGRLLSIFDAHTVISRDDDNDGYYHRLKVIFDADSSGSEVWVYAKLYLSLEGGPWNHYYTTDVFPISSDATDDEYEVVTRLLDGYPTGYYDVLIELYDADFDTLEVNYGPFEDPDLSVLPLEDSYRDDYDDYGGGGAMALLVLPLGLLALLKGDFSYRRRGGKWIGRE